MATGGMLLKIPGAQSVAQADALDQLIRDIFPEGSGVRVSRPIKKVDFRLTGIEESFTPRRSPRRSQDMGVAATLIRCESA